MLGPGLLCWNEPATFGLSTFKDGIALAQGGIIFMCVMQLGIFVGNRWQMVWDGSC
jgi:hypothetical protein